MTRNNVVLPVIGELTRPKTVGECRGGVRPCAWVSCRFNLLIDVLEDGALVLNTPSKRYTGAERTVADKHEFDHDAVWYVEVHLPPQRVDGELKPQVFALGPLGTAEKAREVAADWARYMDERSPAAREKADRAAGARLAKAKARAAQVVAAAQAKADTIRKRLAAQAPKRSAATPAAQDQHAARCARAKPRIEKMIARARARAAVIVEAGRPVPSTLTRIYRKIPDGLVVHGQRREGALDTKFLDEAEDAVERWFDDPDKITPSCLLDEIGRLDGARAADDYEALLEEIAEVMFVSRERVRQVEAVAMAKFNTGLAEHGLTIDQLREQD